MQFQKITELILNYKRKNYQECNCTKFYVQSVEDNAILQYLYEAERFFKLGPLINMFPTIPTIVKLKIAIEYVLHTEKKIKLNGFFTFFHFKMHST